MAISSSAPLQHKKPTNHENDGTENEDDINTFHNREETLTDDIDQIKNHDEDDEDDDDDLLLWPHQLPRVEPICYPKSNLSTEIGLPHSYHHRSKRSNIQPTTTTTTTTKQQLQQIDWWTNNEDTEEDFSISKLGSTTSNNPQREAMLVVRDENWIRYHPTMQRVYHLCHQNRQHQQKKKTGKKKEQDTKETCLQNIFAALQEIVYPPSYPVGLFHGQEHFGGPSQRISKGYVHYLPRPTRLAYQQVTRHWDCTQRTDRVVFVTMMRLLCLRGKYGNLHSTCTPMKEEEMNKGDNHSLSSNHANYQDNTAIGYAIQSGDVDLVRSLMSLILMGRLFMMNSITRKRVLFGTTTTNTDQHHPTTKMTWMKWLNRLGYMPGLEKQDIMASCNQSTPSMKALLYQDESFCLMDIIEIAYLADPFSRLLPPLHAKNPMWRNLKTKQMVSSKRINCGGDTSLSRREYNTQDTMGKDTSRTQPHREDESSLFLDEWVNSLEVEDDDCNGDDDQLIPGKDRSTRRNNNKTNSSSLPSFTKRGVGDDEYSWVVDDGESCATNHVIVIVGEEPNEILQIEETSDLQKKETDWPKDDMSSCSWEVVSEISSVMTLPSKDFGSHNASYRDVLLRVTANKPSDQRHPLPIPTSNPTGQTRYHGLTWLSTLPENSDLNSEELDAASHINLESLCHGKSSRSSRRPMESRTRCPLPRYKFRHGSINASVRIQNQILLQSHFAGNIGATHHNTFHDGKADCIF